MFGFLRGKGRVVYEVPPHEPSAAAIEARIADLNSRIFAAYESGDLALMDRLIDGRNRIRPARPAEVRYVRGRSS